MGVVAIVVVIISGALLGCTPHRRRNATFCDPDTEAGFPCQSGYRCDATQYTCVMVDASGAGDASGPSDTGADGGARDSADDTAKDGGDDATDDAAESTDAASDVTPTCGVCPSSTPICDKATGECGLCTTNDQCKALPGAPRFCAAGTCVGCLMHDDCTKEAPLCSETTHACAGCQADSECKAAFPALPVCNSGPCVECVGDSQCPTARPHCNAGHVCAQCVTKEHCIAKDPAQPVCSGGNCYECAADSDCPTATKPICVMHACKACTTDKQCATKLGADPGVCLFQKDGRCAIDGEALYVAPVAACDDSTGAPASAAKPFCTMQRAILAVSASKALIVVRPGTANLSNWTYSQVAGVTELTVIGQNGATIGAGAGAGITINSGTVYVRGLNVTAMPDVGISASGADTVLKLDRCVVTKNNGGLLINGAGFEINNTVFAENSSSSAAGASLAFGGVYLNAAPSKPMVFRNNTIYANGAAGLVCAGPYVVRGLLVANNTAGQISVCDYGDASTVTSGPTPFNAQFDAARPYHLTAASPCVDKGAATDFPPDDLDGNPRPAGPRSDCGAHELQPAP